ncbi:MAG: BlaI/MecI/CopY family transcriptional regulator [Gracilibacteraceae bacterium]|nr:BlaI/MecI/CopY family transcriptional regulator [Gracilibacteraceae bacterium]
MNRKITDSELAVMRVFWREKRVLTFSDLRELEKTVGWKKTTIQTLMVRLRDKGIIEEVPGYDRRGDVAHYIATVTEQEYQLDESESMLGKVFDGSAVKMVAALRRGGKLSDADIAELRELFKVEGGS